jgi:hypothetical protein
MGKPTRDFNKREDDLLKKIKSTITRHKQYDGRDQAYFFSSGTEKPFQALAAELAALVKDQGVKNTSERLLSIAREVQKLSEASFGNANSIGFAFDRGIEKQEPKNPLAGLKLGK